jgi:mono/diheme cytochrome c family protein
LFFRGDVYVKKTDTFGTPSQAVAKFKKPWVATPALIAHGKELFAVNCVSCHGPEGHGDGVAASGLTPKPRNFTQASGWKNGRKPTAVFTTLQNGIPGSAMASFATLPAEDRWALAHYVLSLGPKPEADTAGDYANLKIDPTKDQMGNEAPPKPSIPVDFAIERMAER